MVSKIISGGQTGVDRAALDVAIKLGIPHGGWVPKGRRAEDGMVPVKYQLREMDTISDAGRAERNVVEADGTLILSRAPLSGGADLTRRLAARHGRPCLHVDLEAIHSFEASRLISEWTTRLRIKILNVAGPQASEDPDIYLLTSRVLQAALFLDLMGSGMPPEPPRNDPYHPRSVSEAVDRLISELSLRDRSELAYMSKEQLVMLYPALGEYIQNKFRFREGAGAPQGEAAKDLPALILVELWKRLRETHLLRLVK